MNSDELYIDALHQWPRYSYVVGQMGPKEPPSSVVWDIKPNTVFP